MSEPAGKLDTLKLAVPGPNGETITFTFNGTVLGSDATNQPSSASVAQVGSTGSSGATSGAGSGSGGGGGFSGVDVGGLLLLLITAMARRRQRLGRVDIFSGTTAMDT